MYLHEVAEEDLSFTKDDMHQGKHTEYERKLQDLLSLRIQQQEQQASTVTTTTASSISSGSTSPVTTITTEGVNGQLTDDEKASSPVIERNENDSDNIESELLATEIYEKEINLKTRNESESSRESNVEESISDICDEEEVTIESNEIECIRNDFSSNELHP